MNEFKKTEAEELDSERITTSALEELRRETGYEDDSSDSRNRDVMAINDPNEEQGGGDSIREPSPSGLGDFGNPVSGASVEYDSQARLNKIRGSSPL